MKVNRARTPKPNELPIFEHEAYALVEVEIWKAIEFLLTKLEPVHPEDLSPDDQQCTICQQKFYFSENPKLSHCPVKTVCGHIFGKRCIIKWLNSLCWWGLEEDGDPNFDYDGLLNDSAKTSCPTCRTEFFARPNRVPMDMLAILLWLWDNVFDYVGVARSEKEELSREHIWKYINYCHSMNEIEEDELVLELVQSEYSEAALDIISTYAARLKTIPLTPIQERLRKKLERIGKREITELMFKLDDGSHVPFFFNPTIPPRQIKGEEEFQVNEFQDKWKINPGSVFVEGDADTHKSFEIERLLNKRTIRRGRGQVTKYLVRWKGYGPEWDCWYALKDLENAKELVEEYETGFGRRTK